MVIKQKKGRAGNTALNLDTVPDKNLYLRQYAIITRPPLLFYNHRCLRVLN